MDEGGSDRVYAQVEEQAVECDSKEFPLWTKVGTVEYMPRLKSKQ